MTATRLPLVYVDLHGASPRPMPAPSRAILCLGSFDGVHIAHRALLSAGKQLARRIITDTSTPPLHHPTSSDRHNTEVSVPCGVFCFFRPPSDDLPLTDKRPRGHLTTLRDKLALFAEAGMDFACLCDFPAVRDLPPAAFPAALSTDCGCLGIVCGFNYRFGHRAAGTPADLEAYFGADRVTVMPEMQVDGQTVSSSRIRACLLDGDCETAARLLGRPYTLTATVTHGKQLGRTLGFPTANQFFPAGCLIPARGVYAVRCHTPAGCFPGVANVGCHPTVDVRAQVNCETYLIGFKGDLYGQRIRIEFLHHLRGEQTFANADALAAAIRRDAAAALRYVPM